MTHVDLKPRLTWGDVEITDVPFGLIFGSNFGVGENLYEIIESELFDGSVVTSDFTENRTLAFEIGILDEPDMAGLELAGARLEREAEKQRSLITFDPGDGAGTPWAVETYRAKLEFNRTDEFEGALIRVYSVEMQAHPHVRSVEEIVIPAIGAGSGVPSVRVTLQDPSTWTATAGGSSQSVSTTDDGTGIAVSSGVGPIVLTRTASVSFIGTPYLHVDYSCPAEHAHGLRVATPGEQLTPVGDPIAIGATRWRRIYALAVPATTPAIQFALGSSAESAPSMLRISGLVRSNDPALFAGTSRQLFQKFPTHGTARTAGNLHIRHENPLGEVLLHTWPDDGSGHNPSCRSRIASGPSSPADPTAASGFRTPLSAVNPLAFHIPIQQLPPGKYRLFARMKAATAGEALFEVTAGTAGLDIGDFGVEQWQPPVKIGTSYSLVELGSAMLPTARAAKGSELTSVIVLDVLSDFETSTIQFDDLYLLNASTGATVILPGGTHTQVFVGAPTIEHPFPSLMIGTKADKSDAVAIEAAAKVWESNPWPPGFMNVFSVCGQPNAAVSPSYFPRFLHNAYEVAG
ncbi:hypothetical protein [Nocardioides alcanivorans]|uniref:hypothetical protein n=1 Tax=Nocardioides alcanivorans TaxID=2897352 RepID=UPI001F37D6D5|nr:hypothetical protein [Nocardioides alcanivorans]